ncbi:hypothetical protein V6N13_077822 [Hibiscus sabdariffa]|uniref:PLATZ transcription factor family protein n=1 Tax=Hibiscus sabdariffa TaxID=183260 RepID=A0ABR2RMJ7_9ROSI
MKVPTWLESLLSTPFFTNCSRHRETSRNECNMYCIDCMNNAFCFYCRSSAHRDHLVIQIRRSSYHDVVRVGEVEKVLDVRGVQTYVINGARVVFLNERPLQTKTTGPSSGSSSSKGLSHSHLCEICGRSLSDPFRFCSLGCKLVGIRQKGDTSFVLSNRNNEEESREGRVEEMYNNRCKAHSNSRRRKGIPHRAPFGP